MASRLSLAAVLVGFALTAAACGGSSSQPESTAAPAAAPAEDHSEHIARVYFKEPADGATVKSPVHIVFGSDMFTIAPVPEGEVTEVRANTGHYHLGVDTDCLPAGTVIPKADPWVHFGKGNDFIDFQLTPGQHKLVVQAGDDKHTTSAGLCQTISVTVAE